MRVDHSDLEAYKQNSRSSSASAAPIPLQTGIPFVLPPATFSPPLHINQPAAGPVKPAVTNIVITGQDMSLDILATHLERSLPVSRPLRSYAGSLDSLIAMYNGESDIVSTHLLDGDTGSITFPISASCWSASPISSCTC